MPESPSPAGAQPLGLTWVDYDHDNDADLIVPRGDTAVLGAARTETAGETGTAGAPPAAAAPGPQMWRNNGNGTFAEVAAERGLAGAAATVAAVGTDFNNDRAIDLVVTGGVHPLVWINPREGAFTSLEWPARRAVADLGAS